jgi:hypothetical protein
MPYDMSVHQLAYGLTDIVQVQSKLQGSGEIEISDSPISEKNVDAEKNTFLAQISLVSSFREEIRSNIWSRFESVW